MIWRTTASRERLTQMCLESQLCELCERPMDRGVRREPHHCFISRGAGGSDFRINVICLHRLCHSAAEADRELNDGLKDIIARRERTSVEAIQEALWFIRRCPKGASHDWVWMAVQHLSREVQRLVGECLKEMECRDG